MRKIVLALCVLGASVAAAPPASSTTNCPDNFVCFWDGQTGSPVETEVVIGDAKRISNKLAKKLNNQASSMENDTAYAVIVYDKRDGRGDRICVEPTGALVNLALESFENVASSTKVTRKASCADLG